MRLVRLLLGGLFVALTVLCGVVVAAVVALCASVLMAVRRMLHSARRTPAAVSGGPRRMRRDDREVIEVTATEVPVDPAGR
jgi:hypothetical protein